MRTAIRFSILVLVLCLLTEQAAAVEKLTNYNFETGTLSGWSTDWTPGTAGALVTSTAAHSGSYGVWEYTANTSAASFSGTYQDVATAAAQRYSASCWTRSAPTGEWVAGGKAFVRLSFLNVSRSVISSVDSPAITTARSAWQQLIVPDSTAPAGAAFVRVVIRVEKDASATGIAVANFDDCSLTQVSTPPAVLSLSKPVLAFYSGTTSLTVDVTNTGAGTLNWQASENAPWLNLSKTSGSLTTGVDTVTFTVDRTGLLLDSYHSVVTFTSDGGSGSIDVYLDNAGLTIVPSQGSVVSVSGYQLLVRRRLPNGQLDSPMPYIIKGAAWSPASIGTLGDELSRQAEYAKWYRTDIPMLAEMSANTVYVFLDFGTDSQAMQVLDALYRAGMMAIVTVDWNGTYNLSRLTTVVNAYKNHPAVLMWAIGNEWNINLYHQHFASLQDAAVATENAAQAIKALDTTHPVASIYGEISIAGQTPSTGQIVNSIAPSVDVWGVNIYRGPTFGTLFNEWKALATKPMFLSEFGTDSFHTTSYWPVQGYADQSMQASFVGPLWTEISNNLSANNTTKVALGGTVFEWVDEWWKVQTSDGGSVTVQDTGGFPTTWNPSAHPDGFANEEFFGIVGIDRSKKVLFTTLSDAFKYQLYIPTSYQTVTAPPASGGAAAAAIVLSAIRSGVAASVTQSEIYNYGHAYNVPANSALADLDPQGLSYALGHFDPYDAIVTGGTDFFDNYPQGNPYQAYNFDYEEIAATESDAFPRYLTEIAKWMAYTVRQIPLNTSAPLVAQPNTPAIVPIFGGYHWVVVKGFTASANPCPSPDVNPWYTPDAAIYGFWISDPQGGALGQESFKTAAECESTYFKPLTTSDQFNGSYLQVAEPPLTSGDMVVSIKKPEPKLQLLPTLLLSLSTSKTAKIDKAKLPSTKRAALLTWRDLLPKELITQSQVIAAFQGQTQGTTLRVHRRDDAKKDYLLVPFGKNGRNGFIVTGVVLVNAADGAFREAAWSLKGDQLIKLSAYDAISLLINKLAGNNKKLRKRLLAAALINLPRTELQWAPSAANPSPYSPCWRVTLNGANYMISQDGRITLVS